MSPCAVGFGSKRCSPPGARPSSRCHPSSRARGGAIFEYLLISAIVVAAVVLYATGAFFNSVTAAGTNAANGIPAVDFYTEGGGGGGTSVGPASVP